jgi:hypothetical protein
MMMMMTMMMMMSMTMIMVMMILISMVMSWIVLYRPMLIRLYVADHDSSNV